MSVGNPILEPALAAVPVIPEHELLRPIASGAYGQVWLARSALGTLRAVKIVRRDRFDRADDFEREFRGLQRFEPVSRTHEALVDILQIGRQDDWFYYIMELADNAAAERSDGVLESGGNGALGPPQHSSTPILQLSNAYVPQTLRQRIREGGSLPAAEVIALGQRLASALAHLHAQELVHRDVKPSNILFVGGEVKLADAGLVAPMDDARSLVGTPGYIPPEGPGTPQADIYSLGKVLYEAAFGKDRQDFPQLPALVAARPDHAQLLELNEIIVKACARDTRTRYANVGELLAELDGLRVGKSVRSKRHVERYWAVGRRAGFAACMVGVLAAGVMLAVRGRVGDDLKSPIEEVNILVAQGNEALLRSDRLDQALVYFKRAVELDPGCLPAQFGVFQAYEHADSPANRSDQRAVARRLMEMDKSLAESHIAAAFIKWYDWRFREALAEARLATKLPAASKVGRGQAHATLGFCLLFTGDASGAEKEFRLAERLVPADPAVQHALGHPCFVQRKFKEALAQYQKSIDLMPEHALGYQMIGQVYEQLGDFDKAIDAFLKADPKADANARRHYEALRLAALNGGPRGYHLKQLEFALEDPKPDPVGVAHCYASLDDMEKAYQWLERAVADHNDNVPQNLMFSLCWVHNDERFKALARKAGLLW